MSMIESTLGAPGSSIDQHLTALFDSFSNLSAQPTSPVARQQVVLAAQSLGASFKDMAERLDASQRDTDVKIRAGVEEVNALSSQIAALNDSIGNAQGGTKLHLVDEQQALVRQLSELVDVNVLERETGGVDLTVGLGRPLVIGHTGYQLGITSTPPDGHAAIASEGTTVTGELKGGRIGGLLHVRDTLMPDYQGRLDQLASDVATQVNAVHRAGYDLTGTTNRDLFTPPGAVAGAAAAFQVDPAIAADPTRIAASGSTATGDNTVARQLAGLRDARVLAGGTMSLSDSWSQLVYRVGRDAKTATDAAASRGQIVRQVDALRDEVSGVSLDEEAMHLLKYQRAYEAIARFFTTIDRSLDTLINTIGR
jgi:flagellar hook-associated protein 1 FlgK